MGPPPTGERVDDEKLPPKRNTSNRVALSSKPEPKSKNRVAPFGEGMRSALEQEMSRRKKNEETKENGKKRR